MNKPIGMQQMSHIQLSEYPPRQVLLFSGHMIDAPDRLVPRFPPEMAAAVSKKITNVLRTLSAGPDDLALAQGASGGDILFLEACKQRGVQLQLILPLPEAEFIEQSILRSIDGLKWQQRYEAIKTDLSQPPSILPIESTPYRHLENEPNSTGDVFARCNLFLLDTALTWGIERLRLICLWDGQGGDGPGGTAHMVELVKSLRGKVIWMDINQL